MNSENIENNVKKNLFKLKVKDIAYIAMFIAVITISSWISIPFPVPFTLQLLAIFLVIYLLGAYRGFISILLYFLLGLAGVPVFASFKAGIGALLSGTGGFLIGFLIIPLVYFPFDILMKDKKDIFYLISMFIGLLITYVIGALWFMFVYKQGQMDFSKVLLVAVVPFIVPDLCKLALAFLMGKKLKKFIYID